MSSTSSGFVVSEGGKMYLLTNAHSVEYFTQVKVKRRGDDRKFLAQVKSIGVDCDVALLDVESEEFWEGVEPLQFGPLPRLQDAVAVVGYPIGGDTQSVTAGVVSRIEVTDYSHGSTDLLAIQIDAAINGGNSGGPALVGEDVENVGYVIPALVVNHFLTDYERTGSFSGFPSIGSSSRQHKLAGIAIEIVRTSSSSKQAPKAQARPPTRTQRRRSRSSAGGGSSRSSSRPRSGPSEAGSRTRSAPPLDAPAASPPPKPPPRRRPPPRRAPHSTSSSSAPGSTSTEEQARRRRSRGTPPQEQSSCAGAADMAVRSIMSHEAARRRSSICRLGSRTNHHHQLRSILIRKLNPTSDASSVLQVNDVLMKFEDVDISNDGTVPFRTGERIAFSYLISNMYIGDSYSMESEYGGDYGTQSPVKLLERLYHGFFPFPHTPIEN
eukprot:gene5850-6136_t